MESQPEIVEFVGEEIETPLPTDAENIPAVGTVEVFDGETMIVVMQGENGEPIECEVRIPPSGTVISKEMIGSDPINISNSLQNPTIDRDRAASNQEIIRPPRRLFPLIIREVDIIRLYGTDPNQKFIRPPKTLTAAILRLDALLDSLDNIGKWESVLRVHLKEKATIFVEKGLTKKFNSFQMTNSSNSSLNPPDPDDLSNSEISRLARMVEAKIYRYADIVKTLHEIDELTTILKFPIGESSSASSVIEELRTASECYELDPTNSSDPSEPDDFSNLDINCYRKSMRVGLTNWRRSISDLADECEMEAGKVPEKTTNGNIQEKITVALERLAELGRRS